MFHPFSRATPECTFMSWSLRLPTLLIAAVLTLLSHIRYWADLHYFSYFSFSYVLMYQSVTTHLHTCLLLAVCFLSLVDNLVVSFLQGLAFLPKTECNVRDVEIAMGLMLTKTTIEPVAFRVPRVKVSQCHHLVDTWEHCIPSLLSVISN